MEKNNTKVFLNMKICQICAVDFTLKTFLLPLVDGLIADGNEVTSVCSNGKHIKGMIDRGYKIKTISISRSKNIFFHIKSTYELFKFLRKHRFDVVHVHTPVAAMIGRLAAFLARTPLIVYTAHGFYFHEDMHPLKKYFFITLEILFGYFTDILFTQSSEDANSAIKYKILSKEKVFAIGNGVDVNKFNAESIAPSNVRKSLNIPSDAFVIGMISRLVKEKGIKEFLQAATKIYDDNKNCYFILVGEKQAHDHAEGVEDFIAHSKKILNENLILTGYRTDTPNLLDAMDLFVLPSWREGMPRSIIEAMMMSKPVLATDIRGSREEVIHMETGILVPVKSPDKLQKAMSIFINDNNLCKTFGESGRKRALKNYNEEVVVALQLKLIKKFYAMIYVKK